MLFAEERDSSKPEASPVEAETSGETVTTEPTQAEEQIKDETVKDESIATPEVADAAPDAPAASDAVSEASGSTAAPEQTETPAPASEPAAQDAVSDSSGTTSAPLGQSEAQPEQSTLETAKEKVGDLASSATETATAAAASARQAFNTTASTSSAQQNAAPSTSPEFPPRQPSTTAPRAQQFPSAGPSAPSSGLSGPSRTGANPSRILYIGNLFFEVTAQQLEAEFARYGEITNSRVVTDSRGLSKGFAYIEFSSQDAADRAVRELDQKVFQGRRMAVQYHVRREPRGAGIGGRGVRDPNPPSKTLFIGNMSYQMSDRDLNDLFREIRNVLDVRVAIDRRSGQPRGFAHADFIDVSSAQKAKEHLEKKVIYGRQLKVDFSASSSQSRQV